MTSSIARRRSSACTWSSSRACVSASLAVRLELLAQPDRGGALLVGGRPELDGLRLDPGLDLRDPLPLPLLERRHLALERALGPLEVGLPRAQALLDAPLDRRDHLRHPVGELALAHGELPAALVGEPPLLGHIRRHESACARVIEMRSCSICFAVSSSAAARTERRASATISSVGAVRAWLRRSAKREDDGADRDGDERAEQEPGDHDIAAMLEPKHDQGGREHDRGGCEQPEPALLGGDERNSRRAAPRVPSASSSSPSTAVTRRRTKRTWLESARCARERRTPNAAARNATDAEVAGDRRVAAEHREAAPREPEPEVGVEATACKLEVVREHEEDAERNEQRDPGLEDRRADEPDRARGADRDDGEAEENAVGDPRAERPSAELVERVRADPDARARKRPRRRRACPTRPSGARQPPMTTYERCHAV